MRGPVAILSLALLFSGACAAWRARAPLAVADEGPDVAGVPGVAAPQDVAALGQGRVVGLDARAGRVVVALEVDDGVTIVSLDAAGAETWRHRLAGEVLTVTLVRFGDDGAVAVAGRADASLRLDGEAANCSDRDTGFVIAFADDGRHVFSSWSIFGDAPATVTALTMWNPSAYGLGGSGARVGPGGPAGYFGQVFRGQRHAIDRLISGAPVGVDQALGLGDGTLIVAGTFEGELELGGRPSVRSPARTTFTAAVAPERGLWLTALAAPPGLSGLRPLALAQDDPVLRLALSAARDGGGEAIVLAELRWGGVPGGWCAVAPAEGPTIAVALAPGLAVVATATEVRLVDVATCAPRGALPAPAGERFVAARLDGERLVVATEGAAGVLVLAYAVDELLTAAAAP